jgi:carbon monoxide dehydrogenase subunit G
MAEITVARTITSDPGAVWALLADFGDIAWIPGVEGVTLEGEGEGMRRRIPIPDAEPITEQLESLDPDERVLVYTITNNPIPTSSYRSVCTVSGAGDGTTIEWAVEFEPIGDEAEVGAMIEGVYGMMAGWIEDATKEG